MPYTNVPEELTEKMDSCVKQVMEKDPGLSKESAIAICHTTVVQGKNAVARGRMYKAIYKELPVISVLPHRENVLKSADPHSGLNIDDLKNLSSQELYRFWKSKQAEADAKKAELQPLEDAWRDLQAQADDAEKAYRLAGRREGDAILGRNKSASAPVRKAFQEEKAFEKTISTLDDLEDLPKELLTKHDEWANAINDGYRLDVRVVRYPGVGEKSARPAVRKARYSGDPREMTAKYPGTCAACGKPFKAGDSIIYWPNGRKAYHAACGEKDYRAFLAAAADEDGGANMSLRAGAEMMKYAIPGEWTRRGRGWARTYEWELPEKDSGGQQQVHQLQATVTPSAGGTFVANIKDAAPGATALASKRFGQLDWAIAWVEKSVAVVQQAHSTDAPIALRAATVDLRKWEHLAEAESDPARKLAFAEKYLAAAEAVAGMRKAEATDDKSRREIERWTNILDKDKERGLERLRNYLASKILGRNFNEEMDDYLNRMGLTGFWKWAVQITNPGGAGKSARPTMRKAEGDEPPDLVMSSPLGWEWDAKPTSAGTLYNRTYADTGLHGAVQPFAGGKYEGRRYDALLFRGNALVGRQQVDSALDGVKWCNAENEKYSAAHGKSARSHIRKADGAPPAPAGWKQTDTGGGSCHYSRIYGGRENDVTALKAYVYYNPNATENKYGAQIFDMYSNINSPNPHTVGEDAEFATLDDAVKYCDGKSAAVLAQLAQIEARSQRAGMQSGATE